MNIWKPIETHPKEERKPFLVRGAIDDDDIVCTPVSYAEWISFLPHEGGSLIHYLDEAAVEWAPAPDEPV